MIIILLLTHIIFINSNLSVLNFIALFSIKLKLKIVLIKKLYKLNNQTLNQKIHQPLVSLNLKENLVMIYLKYQSINNI
jgi:hypothetical protein